MYIYIQKYIYLLSLKNNNKKFKFQTPKMSQPQTSLLNKSLDDIIKEKNELKKQQVKQKKINSAINSKSFRRGGGGGRKDFGGFKRGNKIEFLRNKQYIRYARVSYTF